MMLTGFQLFDQGIPSQTIRNQKEHSKHRDRLNKQWEQEQEDRKDFKEAQRVLSMLRPISTTEPINGEEAFRTWLKLIKGR
jgi:hypothetical protein